VFKRPAAALLVALIACATCLAQRSYLGITPGKSFKHEVEGALGQPVTQVSETLLEYKPPMFGFDDKKIYVQYRKGSPVVERIEALKTQPIFTSARGALPGVSSPFLAATRTTPQGKLEEYYGAPDFFVLTYEKEGKDSGVARVGYYSRELFEDALKRPGVNKSPPPSSLDGWAGKDGDGRHASYVFLEGNRLLVTHGGKTRVGTWKLTDIQVSMEAASDGGTEQYTGVIVDGYRMLGTYTVGPRTVRWEAMFGALPEGRVGAGFELDKDKQLVINFVDGNAPAGRAGLKPGDVIVEIEGQSTAGMSVASAAMLVRGQAGTPVKLKMLASDRSRTFEVTLIREIIK
jgi:PDZ domain